MKLPMFTAEEALYPSASHWAASALPQGQVRIVPQLRDEWGMDCSSGECVGYHCWEDDQKEASICEFF